MKRIAQWVVAGLLVPVAGQAQVGVRAGGSVAGLQELFSRNTLPTRVVAGLGYEAGVYYQVRLGRHWAVVPEVQFSRESQQLRREGFIFDNYAYPAQGYLIHDYQASFSYVAVPVLMRRAFGPVYAEVGPQASVLVGGRSRGENRLVNYTVARQTIDQAAPDFYQRFEAGVCVGVGLRLPAGWGVSARAYQGLTSLTADSKDYTFVPVGTPVSGTQYRRSAQLAVTRDLFRPAGPQ